MQMSMLIRITRGSLLTDSLLLAQVRPQLVLKCYTLVGYLNIILLN